MARKFPTVMGLIALLIAAAIPVGPGMGMEGAVSIPDLTGDWARTTFGFELPATGPGPVRNLSRRADGASDSARLVGDFHNPILKPEASEIVKKRGETSLAGLDYPEPSNQCWPMVAPDIFRVQGIEVLQGKDQVIILYVQDHQFRQVRLNQRHSAQLTPTWHGDSVGHYEGDTLLVDTVGIKVGPIPSLDLYGTPYSEALHVVERYRLIDGEAAREAQERNEREYGRPATEQAVFIDLNYKGKGLQVQFTVEDKNIFTMPWSGSATYRRAANQWVENVCAENRHEYYAGRDAAVPQADNPDF
jgi:hypothetical protein